MTDSVVYPVDDGSLGTRVGLYWSGVFFAWTMYGIVLVSGSRYLRRFPSDPLWMRLFVGYLLIHNTAESGVALSSIIKTFGINYGDYGYLVDFHLRLEDMTLLYIQLLNIFLCQLFLVFRSFLVTRAMHHGRLTVRRSLLFAVMLLFVLASLASGVTRCVMLDELPNYNAAVSEFSTSFAESPSHNYTLYMTAWMATSSVADILITCVLTAVFYTSYKSNRNSEKSVQSTNTVLRYLVMITIRNGTLVTIVQICGLFLFLFSSSVWHSFISYILSRIYSITVIVYISSPRQLSRDLHDRSATTLPVFAAAPCQRKDAATIQACPCICAHGRERPSPAAAKAARGSRVQFSQEAIRKLGRLAYSNGSPSLQGQPSSPLSHPPVCKDSAEPWSSNTFSGSASSSSQHGPKRKGRKRSSNFSLTPRVVVLYEGEEEEEEWMDQRNIFVASSVEVSVEEIGRGATAEDGGLEEDWQERRDRLGLGNNIAIETRSSTAPTATSILRHLTPGRARSSSIATSATPCTPFVQTFISSYHSHDPTSSTATTSNSTTSRHSPCPAQHPSLPTTAAPDAPIPFVNSFPTSAIVSVSSGVYDPDADMEYELGDVLYGTADGEEPRVEEEEGERDKDAKNIRWKGKERGS